MLQIKFGETIPITRQLEDPADSDTNYVRAYVYKFRGNDAGSLLTTLNLTDKGSQRFEYLYEAPMDTNDYFLQVIIKVFTDAAYTTESNRYERSQETYLVAERWGLQFGHGGGADVDYKKIQKMISDAVGGIPKPEKSRETDLSPVMGTVKSAIKEIIEGIKIPQQKEVDFTSLILEIKGMRKEIVNAIQNIPEPEHVDLEPVLGQFEKLQSILAIALSSHQKMSEEKQKEINDKIGNILKNIKNGLEVKFGPTTISGTEPPVKSLRRIFGI